jgi:PAS domain-containing protein
MRIRSIKPEFWRSDDIASLDWETRLLFIGLWSYVDDNGVGIDRLASIAADLFSGDLERDPPETFARVSRGLQTLSEAGRITRYTVENKAYLEITNWSKHQRIDKPNKPRFPRSDDDAAVFRDTLARVTEKEAPGTEEQRNRGTEEQGIKAPAPAVLASVFDDAWTHWPKKVERKQALGRFKAAVKRYARGSILDTDEEAATRLARQIAHFGDAYAATTERQFVPALGVWLAGDRWNDELPQSRQPQQQAPRQSRGAQALEFAMQLPEGGNKIGSQRDSPAIGGGVEY